MNKEQNNKIAGRILDQSSNSPEGKDRPPSGQSTRINNLIQFTRAKSPHWGGCIRQLINRSIEIFEAGPDQH